jgi:hypothetical protein
VASRGESGLDGSAGVERTHLGLFGERALLGGAHVVPYSGGLRRRRPMRRYPRNPGSSAATRDIERMSGSVSVGPERPAAGSDGTCGMGRAPRLRPSVGRLPPRFVGGSGEGLRKRSIYATACACAVLPRRG